MSLSDINPQIDPAANPTTGNTATGPNNGTTLKETVVNNVSSATNAVKNHPITQNVVNGPVAQSVSKEATQTSNEFGGLANSRQVPSNKAANGQDLTNYHSFFYTLLSWKHPRATALTFAATIVFIFSSRYLPVLKWMLKGTYMILGVVTLTEVAAKLVMGSSVASSVRPRTYYKIPKESLEVSLDDLEHLINFFVIEFQRIVFAENITATAVAFTSAFVSYFLAKVVPFWGLALMFTCVVYLAPLIYIQNKELIDGQLEQASNIIGQQTQQARELANAHTAKGIENLKAYTNDVTTKASELVGQARQKIPTPAGATNSTGVNANDFPTAPKSDLPSSAEHTKPVVRAPTGDAPIAASSI